MISLFVSSNTSSSATRLLSVLGNWQVKKKEKKRECRLSFSFSVRTHVVEAADLFTLFLFGLNIGNCRLNLGPFQFSPQSKSSCGHQSRLPAVRHQHKHGGQHGSTPHVVNGCQLKHGEPHIIAALVGLIKQHQHHNHVLLPCLLNTVWISWTSHCCHILYRHMDCLFVQYNQSARLKQTLV